MQLIITGASGYLGGRLTQLAAARGHEVRVLGRRRSDVRTPSWRLGQPPPPALLEGADALVHCAHDFAARGSEAHRVNVLGSVQLFETAHAAGVARLVFVSSVSAFAGCRSDYGRGKLEVEEAVRALGGASLRPGLLFGAVEGGMLARLDRAARLPLLPVFDRGEQPLLFAHVDDVASALLAAAAFSPGSAPVPLVAAHPTPWTFVAVMAELARRKGRRVRTFSIPSSVAVAALRLAEQVRVPLPFRADNLVGLLHAAPSFDFEEPRRRGLHFRPFPGEAVGGAR